MGREIREKAARIWYPANLKRLTPPFLSECLLSNLHVSQFTFTHVSAAGSAGTCEWRYISNAEQELICIFI